MAIASGKGGTGKTTLATGIALAVSRAGRRVQLIDCDVEEPNAAILVSPSITDTRNVSVMVPKIDQSLCTHCGKCSDFCRFNSLVVFPDKVLTFPEMCHSCGGCVRVCEEGAIEAGRREIGVIEEGTTAGIHFLQGRLNIGEARATPLISTLHSMMDPARAVILDAPPGTSCPYCETIRRADVCALVAEPTPFGLYDLEIAVSAARILSVPVGVIINRCDLGDDRVERYCEREGIPIWLRIPHERSIAEAYSRGVPLVDAKPEYGEKLLKLYETIEDAVRVER